MSSLLDKVRGNLEAAAKNPVNENSEKPRRAPREKHKTEVKLDPEKVEKAEKIIIRNCSTNEVRENLKMECALSTNTMPEDSESGRYLYLPKDTVPRFETWAGQEGFFVKQSYIVGVLILDLMMDNSNRDRPNKFHRKG